MRTVFQHSSQIPIVAIHMPGKPSDGTLFLFQFLQYQFADVYFIVIHCNSISGNKKTWDNIFIRLLRSSTTYHPIKRIKPTCKTRERLLCLLGGLQNCRRFSNPSESQRYFYYVLVIQLSVLL